MNTPVPHSRLVEPTDVIFLRKRAEGDPPGDTAWTNTVPVTLTRKSGDLDAGKAQFPVNEYFVNHPERMLGKLEASGTMYGRYQAQLVPTGDGRALAAALSETVAQLPQGAMRREAERCPSCGAFLAASGVCNNPRCSSARPAFKPHMPLTGVKEGAFVLGGDGLVYVRVAGVDLEVQPGQSAGGNVTRLMNAVDSLPERIEGNHALVARMSDKIAGLEAEIARPFEREAEIATVQARLEELDARMSGTATITITVSDGEVLAYDAFVLTVEPFRIYLPLLFKDAPKKGAS